MNRQDSVGEGPQLDDLVKPTRKNTEKLRSRIRELRLQKSLQKHLTSKQLSEDLSGIISESQFDNFINGRHAIAVSAHEALVRHLWENKWWGDTWLQEGVAAHPAALFHALCNFLDAGEQTCINLRREAPGTYRLWRASMHFPGKYLLGKLKIVNDLITGALSATELQIFKGEQLASSHKEIFEGFIVKKSQYYLIIGRQSPNHKGPPRTTVIYNTLYADGLIQAMQGLVIGCYGSNSLFATPVYIERVTNEDAGRADFDEEIRVYETIPESIRAKLKFSVADGVIRL